LVRRVEMQKIETEEKRIARVRHDKDHRGDPLQEE
jgi:hypothetical protein